jgi:hypothetical protein
MRGDGLEDTRGSPSAGGNRDDVGFRREPVVQDRQNDAGVRIEPEGEKGPPSYRPGEVHLLGKGHFGYSAGEIPVGRAANLRVNA